MVLVKQFEMKQINKKKGFLGILLGTLSASFLGILLSGKGATKADQGTIRAGQDF